VESTLGQGAIAPKPPVHSREFSSSSSLPMVPTIFQKAAFAGAEATGDFASAFRIDL
jgi:hypothetical protein